MGSRSRIRWHKVAKLALARARLPGPVRGPAEPDSASRAAAAGAGHRAGAARGVPGARALRLAASPASAPRRQGDAATPPGGPTATGGGSGDRRRRGPRRPARRGEEPPSTASPVAGVSAPAPVPVTARRPDDRRGSAPRAAAPAAAGPAPRPCAGVSRPPRRSSGSSADRQEWKERAMPNAISTGLRTAGALVAASCVALGMAAPATAGSYRAAVCHAGLGAGRAEAAFERTSRHYLDAASCGAGGRGLTVTRERGRTPNGSWGAWSVRAPSGTAISRLSVYAAGRRGAGIVPELGIGAVAGPLTPIATPRHGASARHLVRHRRPSARGAPSLPPGVGLRPRPGGPGSRQAPRREALGPRWPRLCGWAARCSPPEAGAAHRRSNRSAQTSAAAFAACWCR